MMFMISNNGYFLIHTLFSISKVMNKEWNYTLYFPSMSSTWPDIASTMYFKEARALVMELRAACHVAPTIRWQYFEIKKMQKCTEHNNFMPSNDLNAWLTDPPELLPKDPPKVPRPNQPAHNLVKQLK